jgi:hypothetical protein
MMQVMKRTRRGMREPFGEGAANAFSTPARAPQAPPEFAAAGATAPMGGAGAPQPARFGMGMGRPAAAPPASPPAQAPAYGLRNQAWMGGMTPPAGPANMPTSDASVPLGPDFAAGRPGPEARMTTPQDIGGAPARAGLLHEAPMGTQQTPEASRALIVEALQRRRSGGR